ncbi:branched-chain amino acid ABC transporter permease [Catellatospora citrea]|uniref:branched-chain amino acid ABC transporter permease n=1 Tax=Catellatospora citrea TaxID=53366 RepID=UPI0033F33F4F
MVGAGVLLVAVDGICWGMLLAVAASGLALTMGVGGVFNLAHGLSYAAGAYLAWALTDGSWTALAVAAVGALFGGASAGGALAYLLRPLPGHLQQALATIAVALIGGYLLTALFGAEPLAVAPPDDLAGTVTILDRPYPAYRLTFIAAAAAIACGLGYTLRRTRVGTLARAAGHDLQALGLVGVEPRHVHTAVLAAGTALACLAGVLAAPVLGPAPGIEHRILTQSLIIVVIARVSMARLLAVALLLGQIDTTAVAALPDLAPYLPYTILLAVLLTRTALAHRRPA